MEAVINNCLILPPKYKLNSMKKPFYLFTFLLFSAFVARAQTPLNQAVNFTATDVSGVQHTLFDYLDDDKIVVIMFTQTN